VSNIPPQNPYQQPLMYATPLPPTYPPQKDQSLAIIALIMGILSVVIGWACCMFIPLSITAVITGLLGMQKASNGTGEGYGMAVTGVILGGGTMLLYGAFFAYIYFEAQGGINNFNNY